MASFTKRKTGWQAQVRRDGRSISKSFSTKAKAQKWATQLEAEISRGIDIPNASSKVLFSELIKKYREDLFPSIRGKKPEHSRLKSLDKNFGAKTLADITAVRLAEYRNARLKVVGPQALRHEIGLLLRILRLAQSEWGIQLPNGVPKIKMPKLPQGRSRRLEVDEEAKLIARLPALQGKMLMFSLETALRRSELCAMRWEDINFEAHLLSIPYTKTGIPRVIPLSTTAVRILQDLPRNTSEHVWEIQPDSVSQAFSRVCARLGIKDLNWHDLRHEATTRLVERGLTMAEVSLVTGHTTASMLERYTHLRPEELLKKLA